mgnify:CR=1 FL=1
MIPISLSPKQIAGLIGGVAVLALLIVAGIHYRGLLADRAERDQLLEWQGGIQRTVSEAVDARTKDGEPGLLPIDQIEPQIRSMASSIGDLQQAIEDQNADAQARADDLQDRLAREQRDRARLAREARRGEALIDRLRREAEQPGDERCLAPDDFLDQLGDL